MVYDQGAGLDTEWAASAAHSSMELWIMCWQKAVGSQLSKDLRCQNNASEGRWGCSNYLATLSDH